MEYLCHYGIRGMRWGIRRSPAQLGYKNDSDATKRKAKAIKDEAAAAAKKIKIDGKNRRMLDRAQRKADAKIARAEARFKPKESSSGEKSIKDMSDEELRSKIQRIQLEKQLSALTPEEVSKGKAFFGSIGKDVLAPALKQAGKEQLQKFLSKKIGEVLGLKEEDSLENLKREVMGLNLKKQKNELDKYFHPDKKESNSTSTKPDSKDDNRSKETTETKSKEQKVKESKSKEQKAEEPKKDSTEGPFEGTVTGEGTSRSNMKDRAERRESSKSSDKVYTTATVSDVDMDQPPKQKYVELGRQFFLGLPGGDD